MVVYVINKYGKPLMSCSPRKARILLKTGKAKVIKRVTSRKCGINEVKRSIPMLSET